jgi:hypothetical protein
VAGFDYVLDTQQKVAHRTQHTAAPPGRSAAGPAGAAPNFQGGAAGSITVGGRMGAAISSNAASAGSGPHPPPPNGAEAPGLLFTTAGPTPLPAPNPLPARTSARPEMQREDLGEQMIEGVMAKGTRTTQTWPIGARGNDRPFQSVSEMWFSAAIRQMVLMKNSDPQRGENTTKLIHIDTSEQPISLFQPPADYSVVDETAGFEIQWTATAKQ